MRRYMLSIESTCAEVIRKPGCGVRCLGYSARHTMSAPEFIINDKVGFMAHSGGYAFAASLGLLEFNSAIVLYDNNVNVRLPSLSTCGSLNRFNGILLNIGLRHNRIVAPGIMAITRYKHNVTAKAKTVSIIHIGKVRARIAGIAVISGLINPE